MSASRHERVEPSSIYDATVAEILIDPEAVGRDLDEAIIRWHVDHPTR